MKTEADLMSKKIIAVNAGPRKGWNTDTLYDQQRAGHRLSAPLAKLPADIEPVRGPDRTSHQWGNTPTEGLW